LDFIGRGKICPHATLATTNPTWTVLGLNCVGFEVDKFAMLRVFLRLFGFCSVNIIQPVPHSRI
jgi:hypothetical protein